MEIMVQLKSFNSWYRLRGKPRIKRESGANPEPVSYTHLEGVEPDPSVETVMKGAEAMREFEPDWIVAMGGGSPIDAAKAMLSLIHI